MEAVGQLTGGVAHDFNNLLTVIVGNLELLRAQPAGRARRGSQRAATWRMQGARRAATLTQRLLAFSRRQPLEPQAASTSTGWSRGMSELLHRTLGETISVETVLAAGLWTLEADPNQLESAILNLAVNARDAMPEGGRLTIETANADARRGLCSQHPELAPGHYVAIARLRHRHGHGPDDLARVFEPFFTTKEPGQGTGLGPQHGLRLRQAVGRPRAALQRGRPGHDGQHLPSALARRRAATRP